MASVLSVGEAVVGIEFVDVCLITSVQRLAVFNKI